MGARAARLFLLRWVGRREVSYPEAGAGVLVTAEDQG